MIPVPDSPTLFVIMVAVAPEMDTVNSSLDNDMSMTRFGSVVTSTGLTPYRTDAEKVPVVGGALLRATATLGKDTLLLVARRKVTDVDNRADGIGMDTFTNAYPVAIGVNTPHTVDPFQDRPTSSPAPEDRAVTVELTTDKCFGARL